MLKKFFVTIMVFLLSVSFVSALDLNVESVTLNDNHDLDLDGDTAFVRLDRGEDVELEVCYTASSKIKDLEMDVFMKGYEYNDISDSVGAFDVFAGERDCVDFNLNIPKEMYSQEFNIWFTATNAYDDLISYDFPVRVRGVKHDVVIDDVSLSPRKKIEAGSAIYATTRLNNLGYRAEDDAKVVFSIPELGLSDSYYLDFDDDESFDPDDKELSGELYLRIPRDIQPGKYDVQLEVSYNRGKDSDVWTEEIEVLEGDFQKEEASKKSTISLATDYQSVYKGEDATFPIVIRNNGDVKSTYELSAMPIGSWGNIQVTPEHYIVLNPGESRTLYVMATPDKAGKNNLLVQVSVDNGEFTKDLSLTVNTKEKKVVDNKTSPSWDNVKKGLEIGLIVLIGLLVILALVVAFSNKGNKGNKKSDDDDAETYY